MVKWLGVGVTVRVRVRAEDREWIFSFFQSDKHLCLVLLLAGVGGTRTRKSSLWMVLNVWSLPGFDIV